MLGRLKRLRHLDLPRGATKAGLRKLLRLIPGLTPRSVAYEYYTPTSRGIQEPELLVVKK